MHLSIIPIQNIKATLPDRMNNVRHLLEACHHVYLYKKGFDVKVSNEI